MSDSVQSRGIGFTSLLTILFIGLKLAKFIDWSWWWVLSPLWLPFVLIGATVMGVFILSIFNSITKSGDC